MVFVSACLALSYFPLLCTAAVAMNPPVLSPGIGGHSIETASPKPADVIATTAQRSIAAVIPGDIDSPVSHVAIYVGGGKNVYAMSVTGVEERLLDDAVGNITRAVAFRRVNLTTDKRDTLKTNACAAIGDNHNNWGVMEVLI